MINIFVIVGIQQDRKGFAQLQQHTTEVQWA